MKDKFLFFFAIVISLSSVFSQQDYYPDAVWLTKAPSELGMNKFLLDSAVTTAIKSENKVEKDLRVSMLKSYIREPEYKIIGPTRFRGGPSGLVIKDGYIAASWGDIERVDMTFSVTKSVLSTVAGLAVDQGLIGDVNDPVDKYVWDGTFDGQHNMKITWQHLLHQSSDWSGTLFGLHDWADRPPKDGSPEQWKNRALVEPGTVFEYNDVRVNLLAYSLLHVWRKPLPAVIKEKIMDPIGASSTWRWYGYGHSYINMDGIMMQSVSGGGHHGGGLFSSSLDLARVGLLFLRKGKWRNKQLISEDWIRQATEPSPSNKAYGYMWWLNADQTWKSLSTDIFYALGYGGNYIIIDRKNDLVVVARWMDGEKIEEVLSLITQSIVNKK
ncbi:MAG: serine hydrolase [Saprospiraceae bacterium]|nr:serine hydrolase [Saprospiraceae bacterium]